MDSYLLSNCIQLLSGCKVLRVSWGIMLQVLNQKHAGAAMGHMVKKVKGADW